MTTERIANINCPHPDHEDNTPSCSVYSNGTWFCRGAKHKGKKWGTLKELGLNLEDIKNNLTFGGSRGITDNKTIKKKGVKTLNYSQYSTLPQTADQQSYLISRNLSPKITVPYGVLYGKGNNSISFPVYNIYGLLTGHTVRYMNHPKLKSIQLGDGLGYPTYGVIHKSGDKVVKGNFQKFFNKAHLLQEYVVIVESVVDALSLLSLPTPIKTVIGGSTIPDEVDVSYIILLGVKTTLPFELHELFTSRPTRVHILFDPDANLSSLKLKAHISGLGFNNVVTRVCTHDVLTPYQLSHQTKNKRGTLWDILGVIV